MKRYKSMLQLCSYIFIILIVLLNLPQFTSCDKTELICPVTVSMVVSPLELVLDDDQPTGKVYFSTQPAGKIKWQMTDKPNWIELEPPQGTLEGEIQEISVKADPDNFDQGTYYGKVELISDIGGAVQFIVILNVKVYPKAEVSVDSLKFTEKIERLEFDLKNTGSGYLRWSLSSSETWLTAEPVEGTLYPDEAIKIIAAISRKGMAIGSYPAKLTVKSNSKTGILEIPVKMDVSDSPNMEIAPDSLIFNPKNDSLYFTIYNTGNSPFNWEAQTSQFFIQISPTSGTISKGDSSKVLIRAVRDDLTSGSHIALILLSNNVAQSDTVTVTVNHFKEDKWLLDHRIIDSEYDRSRDVIVTVADAPSKLFVLRPQDKTMQSVDLALTPECVAVRPDGAFAAVGHNGYVSYVNLNSMTVEQVYAVTTDAIDIILPSNGWVYVFPRTDQWESIRCIELATGVETTSGGWSIYAGTLAKLHPSREYIYGANNGLSPSDFEKYDIRNGTAVVMYDSPYHGDYDFGGNIWISDDGQRLFARSGNVFRSSNVASQDMTYNGNLAGLGSIIWLDYSTNAQRLYAIGAGDFWNPVSSEIRVYETSYLAFKGTIPLPGFLVPKGINGEEYYKSEGQFVFVNSTGTKIYALVKAEAASGLLHDWAVVDFDVNTTQ
jgi:hypothetical protein